MNENTVTLNNIEDWLRLFRGATRVNVKKTLQRKVKFTPIFTALLITVILTLSLFKPSSAALISEYNLAVAQNPDPRPWGIAVDSYGNVWFTERFGAPNGRIGMLSGTTIYEWKLPDVGSEPCEITVDKNDVIWLTLGGLNKIGRFEKPNYVDFTLESDARPMGITVDEYEPLQKVWFTEYPGNRIGKIYYDSTDKKWIYIQYTLPAEISGPMDIAVSPYNGFVWFTTYNKKIGSFNPWSLKFQIYSILADSSPDSVRGLAIDSSGFVWFGIEKSDPNVYDEIGRLNPWTAEVVFYEIPTVGAGPVKLVVDKNNYVWFTEHEKGKIGRLDSVTQYITEYEIPNVGDKPLGIATKKNGETPIYFTELLGNKIGILDPTTGITYSTVNTITSATTKIETKTTEAKNVADKTTKYVASTPANIKTIAGTDSSTSRYASSTVTTNVETFYVKPATTTITTTSPIVHVSTTGTTKLDTLTTYVSTTSTTTTTTLTATYSTPVATETTVVTRYEVFTDYVSTTTLTEYAATSYRWKTTTAEYYTSYSTSTIKTTVTRTTTITQTATQYTSITQGTTILYTTVTTTTTRILGASLGYATPTIIVAGLIWLLSNRSNKPTKGVKRR
jgi:streptogramin lyase